MITNKSGEDDNNDVWDYPDNQESRPYDWSELELLQKALSKLRSRYRMTLELRYHQNKTYSEIGIELGVSKEMVRRN